MHLLRNERTTRLGRLGEALAAERLEQHGFSEVENLNEQRLNYPFADLLAVRGGRRFLISVKARNEMRQGGDRRNDSYNLVQIRDTANAHLKRHGGSTDEITRTVRLKRSRLPVSLRPRSPPAPPSVPSPPGDAALVLSMPGSIAVRGPARYRRAARRTVVVAATPFGVQHYDPRAPHG